MVYKWLETILIQATFLHKAKGDKVTIEEKKEALLHALGESWDKMFRDWKWEVSKNNPNSFILSGKEGPYNPLVYLAGCSDANSSMICVEYNPTEDLIGICLKYRPIKAKFKEDLVNLFAKHAPFNMTLSFDEKMTPIVFKEEKVEPIAFTDFLEGFRKAYNEYYPIFYMISVCETEWYDGFAFRCYDTY